MTSLVNHNPLALFAAQVRRAAALPRFVKVGLQVLIDSGLLLGCFWLAMVLRLDRLDFISDWRVLGTSAVGATFGIAALFVVGVYGALVRFIAVNVLPRLMLVAGFASLGLYGAGLFLEAHLPRSVPLIYAVLVVLTLSGMRFGARELLLSSRHRRREPVIVYGAGQAGFQLIQSLMNDSGFEPVGLVDDDPKKHRLQLAGLRVRSPEAIGQIAHKTQCSTVMLAMPTITKAKRKEIIQNLAPHNLAVKTIPRLSEVISGHYTLNDVRSVQPDDLLGRDPVPPTPELLFYNNLDKVVMITGAGGSIGSELCRQVLALKPSKLVLYEQSEFALYTIRETLTALLKTWGTTIEIVAILGSVLDQRKVEQTLKTHGVDTIYHAAAYKHVPLVEENPFEGIRNNVFGTRTVAKAAAACNVASFTLISTDKAVRPTNIMGASKRLAELVCQAEAKAADETVFSMVRFGNVLGSSGSVIPKFQEQIAKGGPVTVTHKDITRYFMTIREASELVIQAGAMAFGGEVFVLDMGEPVKIYDLAKDMIRLNGLTPITEGGGLNARRYLCHQRY